MSAHRSALSRSDSFIRRLFRTKRPGVTSLTPAIIGLLAVVGFLLVLNLSLTQKYNQQSTATTNTINATVNSSAAVDTNTSNTNTTASADSTYPAPTGPFTIVNSATLAVASRQPTDRLVTRLNKVNVATGASLIEAQIRSTDIPTGLTGQIAGSPSRIQFGADGESIIFLSSNLYSGTPYTGIYRTGLTTQNTIEKIVQYDPTNLFNGDVPSINDVAFDAERNRAVFMIGGSEGKENTYLMLVNLTDKKVKQVKVWSTVPQFVGFIGDGTAFQVFRRDDDNLGNDPKGKGYLENIDLVTGKVTKSILIYNEATFDPKLQVYQQQEGVSPNAKVFAFSSYQGNYNQTYFWNIATKELTTPSELLNMYASGMIWSPDSGKLYFQTNDHGTIFDLAKGIVATIPKGSQGITWWPGVLPVIRNQQGTLLSYDLDTKKTTTLIENISSNEYGGDSVLGWGWVNR